MKTSKSSLSDQAFQPFDSTLPAELSPFREQSGTKLNNVPADNANVPADNAINWQDHLQRCQSMAKIGSWEANINGENFSTVEPIYWSDEFYKILGYNPGEVSPSIDLIFQTVATPEDLQALGSAFSRMLETGEPLEQEHSIITKQGEKRILYNKGQLIYKNGRPYRVIGTTQDVTEQRNTHDELAATGKKLTNLFNNMKEIFFSVHIQKSTTFFISPSCLQVYGYDQQAFMSNPNLWFDAIVDEDKQRIQRNNAILEKGQRLEQEYRIRHKDGSIKWIEAVIFPTLDENGKLLMIDGFSVDITKRKQAEQSLKDSENRFRSIIQNSGDVIVIVNEHCEITFATASLYKVTGYRPTEVIGKKSFGFIYPEDFPNVQARFEESLQQPSKSLNTTYRRVRKDGSLIWCEGTVINLLHVPEVAGLVITFRDISARKKIEQALEDSEIRFRSLIQNSSDAILLLDNELKILFASDAYYRITGYSPMEITERDSLSLIHPEDIGKVTDHMNIVFKNPGKAVTIRYRRQCKDGVFRWVESVTTNMLHRPEINGIILNQRDISESVEAEQALQHSENKLRALISQSSDAITITGQDLKFRFCNESLFKMSGYASLEEFNVEMVHPEDVAALQEHLQWLMAHPDEPKEMTFRIKKSDGTYLWVERVSVNKFNDPAINGILSNFRDITERKLYLEALQKTNDELSKTNMELDKFVYRVSHDLRAPLLSILGLIELTKTEEDRSTIGEYLDMMDESVKKLDRFILDILDYSKNSRTEIRKEEFNLHELVNDIINNLRFINAGSDTVSVENLVPENLQLEADKGRISVVLGNLISNSIRYSDTSAANPFVKISASASASAAELSVEDNGVGICENDRDKIFQMFYRGSSQSTGSGLGLYIVKETTDRMGGSIRLSSVIGKGTKFTITL